jgi:hypothetical protein
LQHADGIIAVDLGLRYDASRLRIRDVVSTGIGAALMVASNDRAGDCAVALYGTAAMTGSGSFVKVTYEAAASGPGVPFTVLARANEGQIPIVRSPALTTGGSSVRRAEGDQ